MKAETPRSESPSVVASAALQSRLEAVRRKFVLVASGTGFAMSAGAFVIFTGAAMALDWWLDFPLWVRVLLLAGNLGGVGWLVWRYVAGPIRFQPDEDSIALAVERAFPQFRSRLISSIQFPRPGVIPPGAATSLARMTIVETEALAAPLDFSQVVKTADLQKASVWSIAVLALGLFTFMYGGEVTRDLLKRVFLSSTPVPRHTRVELVNGDQTVGRGDTVRIEAFARGVVPRTGRLIVKSSGRRTQEYVLEKNKDGRFSRALENVQQTFTYVVELNDGSTKSHQIEVVPRPAIASVECQQLFPPYTRLPAVKRPLGDLTLLAGSKLHLAAVATKDVIRAFVRFAGTSNDIPMQVSAVNPRSLQAEFSIPPRGLTGFSIEMVDTGGMESRDSAVYRVDVVPDRAPKVKITVPDRKEELATRYATVPVLFEANDDFQIAKASMRYRVGETEDAETRSIQFEVPTNIVASKFTGFSMTNLYNWAIRDFQPPLAEGTRIEFWLEVEDNNDVTGPGRTASEHQLLRIVSDNDKRADLLNRAGDFLGTINDVTGDQEKLNLRLFDIIMEKKQASSNNEEKR